MTTYLICGGILAALVAGLMLVIGWPAKRWPAGRLRVRRRSPWDELTEEERVELRTWTKHHG